MVDNVRCRSRIGYKNLETETHHRIGHKRIYTEGHHQEHYGKFYNFTQKDVHVIEDEFAQQCLRAHNHFRAHHGCAPLHLSVEVSKFSQEWAEHISKEDHLHHSHHPRYGENLFVKYFNNNSLPITRGCDVVESWYSEHKHYPFTGYITREIISKAGHFTQVVWSNSRELGVGQAVSKSNRVYVVANYYPSGNVMNKFNTNVPKRILKTVRNNHTQSMTQSGRLFTKAGTKFYFDSWIEY